MLKVAVRPRRVLILTAAVGEGHLAAARALAEQFELERPAVDVTVMDVLAIFGPFLRFLLLDAYRAQLRCAPWIFGLLFFVFRRLGVLRRLGGTGLAILGARRLERCVRAGDAELVISTYPAATSVLGYLRRRGRVDAIACATITDLGCVAFWAHPGIDLHLVMHEGLVAAVEREAGPGSAQMTKPLVTRAFLEPVDGAAARRELGIPETARVVVVSGGGWGVGNIAGGIRAALAFSDVHVVAVAGRNHEVERELRSEFGGSSRVRVLGFTSQMSDLLAAANALVHTTGGVTCLEAFARNCPIISFGAPPGHVRAVSRAMHSFGVAVDAPSPRELRRALDDVLLRDAAETVLDFSLAPSAATALLATRSRQFAQPAARRRARVAIVAFAAVVVAAVMAVSSVSAYALVAEPLGVAPASAIATALPQVGLVVKAPARMLPSLARMIGRAGARASFAFSSVPPPATQRVLRAHGDSLIPSLTPTGFLGWISTADNLEDADASVRGVGVAYCLAPNVGLTAGEYLLARAAGVNVITGSLSLGARSPVPARIRRGAIVVLRLQPGEAGSHLLLRVLTELRRERLRTSSFTADSPIVRQLGGRA